MDNSEAPVTSMKRIASPKMRHVRALSPYANSRGTEQGPPDNKTSFLMKAGGINSEAGKSNVNSDINKGKVDF